MSPVAEQIRRAADLIERDGHSVGDWRGEGGSRCMANALAVAAGVSVTGPRSYERAGTPTSTNHPVFEEVTGALHGTKWTGYPLAAICDYNNAHSAEDVVAKLRDVAATIELREAVPA